MPGPSRRRFLRHTGAALTAAGIVAGPVTASHGRARTSAFDSARDGFGFRNWAAGDGSFREHRHGNVSETEIQATIKSSWRSLLGDDLGVKTWSSPFVRSVARQLYVSVNQQTATNGHCFGLVFAAQQYHEDPETLPLSAESASDLTHPAAPLDDRSREPVGELVDLFHNTQTLSPWSWLGRRQLVMPRQINLRRELSALQEALAEFGTATITLVELGNRTYHQVLVYGARKRGSTVQLLVYDPNFPARYYQRNELTINVDTARDPVQMQPFRAYDRFVFNRHERRVAASGAKAALVIDRAVIERLSRLVLFLVDSDDLDLVVRDPNGSPVGRDTARTMNRERTEYSRVRYRYGAPAGDYRITVLGRSETDYNLSALAAARDGSLIDTERSARIEPGETHEYVATIPEEPDRAAKLRRDGGGNDLLALGVGALSAGAGAAAYRYYRRL